MSPGPGISTSGSGWSQGQARSSFKRRESPVSAVRATCRRRRPSKWVLQCLGAADDGAGVAAIFEISRALTTGSQTAQRLDDGPTSATSRIPRDEHLWPAEFLQPHRTHETPSPISRSPRVALVQGSHRCIAQPQPSRRTRSKARLLERSRVRSGRSRECGSAPSSRCTAPGR